MLEYQPDEAVVAAYGASFFGAVTSASRAAPAKAPVAPKKALNSAQDDARPCGPGHGPGEGSATGAARKKACGSKSVSGARHSGAAPIAGGRGGSRTAGAAAAATASESEAPRRPQAERAAASGAPGAAGLRPPPIQVQWDEENEEGGGGFHAVDYSYYCDDVSPMAVAPPHALTPSAYIGQQPDAEVEVEVEVELESVSRPPVVPLTAAPPPAVPTAMLQAALPAAPSAVPPAVPPVVPPAVPPGGRTSELTPSTMAELASIKHFALKTLVPGDYVSMARAAICDDAGEGSAREPISRLRHPLQPSLATIP